jgi:hypothetical protein
MSKLLRSLAVLGLAAIAVAFTAPAASARPPSAQSTASATGYDVSYPQCRSKLPTGQAFGVVGVNGGLATTANSCLSTQLRWAWQSVGGTSQPRAQTYLNTANPGQVKDQVTTWPSSGTAPAPYGSCDGQNSTACSWVYGYQRAQNSVQNIFAPAARSARVDGTPAAYTWWLDVETTNTWQTGGSSEALANNRATLEGMTAYLQGLGARVGIYSTGFQWKQIVGTVPSGTPLYTLNSWLAGATTAAGATANCGAAPLVGGGTVTVTQYVSGGVDRDLSCIG